MYNMDNEDQNTQVFINIMEYWILIIQILVIEKRGESNCIFATSQISFKSIYISKSVHATRKQNRFPLYDGSL